MKDIRGRVGFYHIYNLVDRSEYLELEKDTRLSLKKHGTTEDSSSVADEQVLEIEKLNGKIQDMH